MAGQRIWTFVELQGGKAKKVSFEVLTKAREIGEAEAVILGPGAKEASQQAGQYGAKRVYLSEDSAYAEYLVLPVVDTLQSLIEREKPTAVLFGSTDLGKDIASRLAARLDAGLLSEAVEIAFNDGQIEVTRPDFGGTVMCTSTLRTDKTRLVLVRPKAFAAVPVDGAGSPAIEAVNVAINEEAKRARITERVQERAPGVTLEEADIIVSGGRGLGGPEPFSDLKELADMLGAAVGASRAAVDAGWQPYSIQIGQTGKTVKPNIYIAFGISGAIQHKVGMNTSRTIIAVNKDSEAPIFTFCDFGVVGDLFEVLPQLREEVRKRKNK